MIPYSLIKQFASEDKTRPALLEPVVVAERMVATNGRVLVEVPVCEVDLEGVALRLAPADFPAYKVLLNTTFSALASSSVSDCAVPFQIPGKSEDHMVAVECYECSGTGEFSEPGDCWDCDGKGKWQECDWRVEYPGGSWLNGLFAEQVMSLPDITWYLPSSPESMIPFRFGHLGRGLIMPMRPPSYAQR
jgi:hypothetical protein